MISTNTTVLHYGIREVHKKVGGDKYKLKEIKEYDVNKLVERNNMLQIRKIESNILRSLKEIKEKNLKENEMYFLQFDDNNDMTLEPATEECRDCQINQEVKEQLLP